MPREAPGRPDEMLESDHDRAAPGDCAPGPVFPEPSGLFDPRREYDACGVGFIADLKGGKSHQHRQGCALHPREPRASRRRGCRPARRRRRRHPDPDPARVPGRGVREAQDQAAQARPLRRRSRLHAAGRAAARALRARVDAHHPRGGPGVPGLALGAGRQLLPVGDDQGGGAGAPADLHRPAEGDRASSQEFERRLYLIRKVVSNALHYAYKDRDIGHYTVSLSSRTLVYKGMFLSYQVKAYYKDLSDPRARLGDGARAPALLHQHLPVVEAGAPLPHGRPQRRDQHAARQRQLDGGAAGVGVLAAVRQRHLQAVADLLRGPVRHGLLRQRARVPGDGRLQPRRMPP